MALGEMALGISEDTISFSTRRYYNEELWDARCGDVTRHLRGQPWQRRPLFNLFIHLFIYLFIYFLGGEGLPTAPAPRPPPYPVMQQIPDTIKLFTQLSSYRTYAHFQEQWIQSGFWGHLASPTVSHWKTISKKFLLKLHQWDKIKYPRLSFRKCWDSY